MVRGAARGRRSRRAPALRAPVLRAVLAVAALVAGACSSDEPSVRRPAPSVDMPRDGIDARILVVTASTTTADHRAVVDALAHTGVPHDVLDLASAPAPSPAELARRLSDRTGHGRYRGIVYVTGNTVADVAQPNNTEARLTSEQKAVVAAYQVAFKVRSVTANTYPDAAFGLRYDGYVDTATAPLALRLTEAGSAAFDMLNPAGSMAIRDAGVYLGSIVDPARTFALVTANGPDGSVHPIVSTHVGADGRENLAITAGNGPTLLHSIAFGAAWLEWLSGGVHLGERTPSLAIEIDDLFLTVATWDVAAHRTSTTAKHRNDRRDIEALVAWAGRRQSEPTTPSLRPEFAFVGSGTDPGKYPGDTLVGAVLEHRDRLRFVNHTFSHYDLDCGATATCGGAFRATAEDIRREIIQNVERGKQLGLASDWDAFVQPDVSGVNGVGGRTSQAAAADAGTRYWISDTSRPGGANPSFNIGIRAEGDDRIYIVPRHPTNLFYDDATPEQWVDEFNHAYAPGGTLCATTRCFDRPQTYAEILDHESESLVRYLLSGDNDPIMFHTPNVTAYDGAHSLLTDLVDAALAKYEAWFTTPVRNPSLRDVAGQTVSVPLDPCA